MKTSSAGLSIVLMFAALIAMPSAWAEEGRIPIFEPTTILQPGRYVVTRDITELGFTPAITISADNVDLDLNGFTIYGPDPAIQVTSANNVDIHHGVVSAYETAIAFSGSVDFFWLRNLIIKNPEDCAVVVSGTNGYITENRVSSDGGNGGFCVNGTGLSIVGNHVRGGSGAGIFATCNACRIADNVIDGSAYGILVNGDGNLVYHNTISGSMFDGLGVGGDFNQIEGNVLAGNTEYGLRFSVWGSWFGNDNVYRGNLARGNAGSGCAVAGTADFCDDGSGNTMNGDNYLPNQM